MFRQALIAALAAATVTGCTKAPTTKDLATNAATAMGGVDRLRGIQTLQMAGGEGTRFRHGQIPKIADREPPATLTRVVETIDLANGRASLDYVVEIPGFSQHRHEILTRKGDSAVGLEAVEGRPLAVVSPSGLFSWGTQNDPSFLLRRNVVTILLAALDNALDEAPQHRELDGLMLEYGRATLPSGDEVGLFFDPMSQLLHAYETVDTDTMLGDVPARYVLGEYRDVGGVRLPHRITITKAALPYAEVTFASGSINDQRALGVFAIPDAAQADADVAIAAREYSPVTLAPVAPGVMLARAYSHNSLVVEFPTFLAVVEAPYTNAQSATLIRVLASQFPGKPIRYVAPTHHHYDHIGGVRGLAAAGAVVVVEQGHEPPLRALLGAPHTRPPDALQAAKNGNDALGAIEAYNGMRAITEGAQSLQLHAIRGNPHSDPLVIAYVPASGVIFQSDVWFPGLGAPAGADAAHLLKSIQSMPMQPKIHVGGHGGIGSHAELVKAVATMSR
jgi:glyoxylase-like metal-dependent hydrolase (beta-lactamase superfamily II)